MLRRRLVIFAWSMELLTDRDSEEARQLLDPVAEGYMSVRPLGPVPVKGLDAPVEVFELVSASGFRRHLQAAAVRGLTRFVGRGTEFAALVQALERAGAGHGQVVAVVGEAGAGGSSKPPSSCGKATPYFLVIDLLKRYAHIEVHGDPRTVQAKETRQILTLDETLQDTMPALLSLVDALPADNPFRQLDPSQRRQRTLDALKRVLLRAAKAVNMRRFGRRPRKRWPAPIFPLPSCSAFRECGRWLVVG